MTQKVKYLYNNIYNQGCCNVCRRVCKKPCRVKVITDSSNNITDFRVNGKKIRKIYDQSVNFTITYNDRSLKKYESVLVYYTTDVGTIIYLINNISSYIVYQNSNSIILGNNNLKKVKCVLSKRSIVEDQPTIRTKGTLIRNNKIIKKNGNVVITI